MHLIAKPSLINHKNSHLQNKKKILIFIDWFLPAYKAGGPVRSVANIVTRLSDNFDFIIITSDRDLGDKQSFPNITTNEILNIENYKIIYLSPEKQNRKTLINIIEDINYDIVYFNSLFSFKFTILPLILIKKIKKKSKIILAPRGMLGNGSLNIKKTKKAIFLKLSKIIGLYKNITWHATNPVEIKNISDKMNLKTNIVLAPNLPEKAKTFQEKTISGDIKLIFISRIVQIKNIHFAIEVLLKVNTQKKIEFDIFGPIEDVGYYEKCIDLSKKLPENIKLNFKGEIRHDLINKTLQDYHFMFFPTLHENFGHVIFEAFSAGVPVIISKNTPWGNLEKKHLGFDIDLANKNEFVKTIEKICKMPSDKYAELSLKTFNFAKEFSSDEQYINKTINLFEDE